MAVGGGSGGGGGLRSEVVTVAAVGGAGAKERDCGSYSGWSLCDGGGGGDGSESG